MSAVTERINSRGPAVDSGTAVESDRQGRSDRSPRADFVRLLVEFLVLYPFQPATAFWRAEEIRHVLRRQLPPGDGLDLGCGDGLLSELLAREWHVGFTIGVDPDPLEAGLAKRSGLYGRVHVCPGQAVPEPDGSVAWVLSNSVLEHVDDIEAVLAEAARLLRPDGLFLFTVPSDEFHSCLRGPLLPWTDRDAYLTALDARLAHLRYWSTGEWREALRRVGLEVVDVVPYLDRWQVRRWETLSRFTGGLLHALQRRRRRPIEIQRQLGMRSGTRSPRWLAGIQARVLCLGMPGTSRPAPSPAGCVLIAARRREPALSRSS